MLKKTKDNYFMSFFVLKNQNIYFNYDFNDEIIGHNFFVISLFCISNLKIDSHFCLQYL